MEYFSSTFETNTTTTAMGTPEQDRTFETALIFTRKESQRKYYMHFLTLHSEDAFEAIEHNSEAGNTTAATNTRTTNSDEEAEADERIVNEMRQKKVAEEATRKRDKKREDKQNADEWKVCKACRLIVSKTKRRTGMCHNCQKVYEACEEIAIKNGGGITYDETVRGFRITC